MKTQRLSSLKKRSSKPRQTSLKKRGKERSTKVGEGFETQRVAFSKADRGNHTHVIGSTGTGKSKFLEYMIKQDLKNPNAGFCLIDPHGSLYDEVLTHVSHRSPRLAERVVLFNPAEETDHIIGFNPVPAFDDNIDYVLEMLITGCLKAWGQDNSDHTPRITRWLENIFYALMANGMTLVEAVPLISSTKATKPLRERFYANVGNMTVMEDWQQFESSALREKQQTMEGAGNRLRKFLRSEIVRNIIGMKAKTLDLYSIMEEGKILLVNLNGKERVGRENMKLLGVMLVNEIFRIAKLRDPKDQKLKPFYCYIDEFGQFVTRDIAYALEECRKFKLFMILAHQHLAQLKNEDEYLYASVMTNCKNKVVFGGLSVEDSEVMSDELSTGFLDLKKIKDELYSTKTKYTEVVRRVFKRTVSNDKISGDKTVYSKGNRVFGETVNTDENKTTSGESESFVPFAAPEEFSELSNRTFWSKDELHYMEMAAMKNQDTGEAFIKVGSKKPVKTKIDFVASTRFSSALSPKKIDKFKDMVFLHHSSYYCHRLEAQKEVAQRQERFFGEPLIFDERTPLRMLEEAEPTENKKTSENSPKPSTQKRSPKNKPDPPKTPSFEFN